MPSLLKFLHKRAEDVLVLLTVVMFASFIVQIASRYLFNAPTDWTHELILICWLWIVFWGAAFFLEDKDHVKFDVLYNLGAERTRRALSLVAAAVLAIGFLVSVPATWDFISFKKIRSTDILGLRFDWVFGVYIVFLAAVIFHYGRRAWRLAKGESLATLDRQDSV
jgi:TRAP-type C4-dicarboxylate transport system permease small subunit